MTPNAASGPSRRNFLASTAAVTAAVAGGVPLLSACGGGSDGGSRDGSRDPAAFLSLLARERVTVLNQTPSAFHQLAA
ncbi:twin-arginine translocation signal domain-containing protein, partial [Streptomyces rochei]|uniref:twin-arginine translocation signal domain-containing protein n=1 Tax=Streptomyces rochei TaxID=1928 RepID=UPI0036956853